MTLPRKKRRSITVAGEKYNWLISYKENTITLTIESSSPNKKLMQAYFEPHSLFAREGDKWHFVKQVRSVTPKTVRKIILHALKNGWNSNKNKIFNLYTWQTDELVPIEYKNSEGVPLKKIIEEELESLRFELSLDPSWREKLFKAEIGERFLIPEDHFALGDEPKKYNLHFQIFNEGYTNDGFVVFGIESVEFPNLATYSTNNPEIL